MLALFRYDRPPLPRILRRDRHPPVPISHEECIVLDVAHILEGLDKVIVDVCQRVDLELVRRYTPGGKPLLQSRVGYGGRHGSTESGNDQDRLRVIESRTVKQQPRFECFKEDFVLTR